MSPCARCGASEAGPPRFNRNGDYEYCNDCQNEFEYAKENGVVVRSRHSNRAFDEFPYEVYISTERVTEGLNNNKPQSQVAALGEAKKVMDEYNLPGLFIYQKTGSLWLISEYLETHDSIREDVEDYTSNSGDFLSSLF